MPPKKKEEKITVVAKLCVIDGTGLAYTVRSFDKAWHLALGLPRPVHVNFVGFVRKEESK